jgi:uncharacterized protein YcbK (DUF882 family)
MGTLAGVVAFAALLHGWDGPSKAIAALTEANLYAAPMEEANAAATGKLDPAMSASAQIEAVPPTMQMHAVPEKEHFTVEISNTGKVFEVHLGGPAGEPDTDSYRALRHELRCQRSGAESPIDPRLIEILHQISLSTGQRIQVVSAFRGPTKPGDFNYHTRGMAADIRVPGVTTEDLRDLAKSLGATGVGYYPTVQFVHVDVRGTPYFWTDTSGHGEHNHNNAEAIADSNDSAEAAGGEVAQADESAAATQSEVSPEVAAILRPPGMDTSANVAPVVPLAVPTAAAMVVPASVPAAPRAKAAPGEVETANLPAKSR